MGYNIWRSFWTNTVPAPIIITIFVRCHNKKYFFSHQVLDPFMLRTNFICYPKLFLQHHSSGDLFPFYASKHLTKYCIRWTFCTPNSATNNAWARIDSRNYAVAHDHEFRLKYYYRSLYIYNMRCVRYQWTDFHDFFFFLVIEWKRQQKNLKKTTREFEIRMNRERKYIGFSYAKIYVVKNSTWLWADCWIALLRIKYFKKHVGFTLWWTVKSLNFSFGCQNPKHQ